MQLRDLRGHVVVITGATSGIGREAVRQLAGTGAHFALVGRDDLRLDDVRKELLPVNRSISTYRADLLRQVEVHRLAERLRGDFDRIDVLINNAGAMFASRGETEDGFERTWALNHLAYFLLTTLLLDRLQATPGARIVNVASGAHTRTSMRWSDLQTTEDYGVGRHAYAQSKLANILFTFELARRLVADGADTTANCLHPGFVNTRFLRNNGLLGSLVMTLTRPLQRSAREGARTIVHLAGAESVAGITGRYWVDEAIAQPSDEARSAEAALRLWAISEEQIGLV